MTSADINICIDNISTDANKIFETYKKNSKITVYFNVYHLRTRRARYVFKINGKTISSSIVNLVGAFAYLDFGEHQIDENSVIKFELYNLFGSFIRALTVRTTYVQLDNNEVK